MIATHPLEKTKSVYLQYILTVAGLREHFSQKTKLTGRLP